MSIPTLTYNLTDGTTAYGSQVYSDLTSIVAVLNGNLDSSNVSPARGIGANFIAASGGSGATGAFQPGAYSFTSGLASQTPLAINGIAGQTADVLSVSTNGSYAFRIHADGSARMNGAMLGPITCSSYSAVAGDQLTFTGESIYGLATFKNSTNNPVSTIDVNGNYAVVSDARTKMNIRPLSAGLEAVLRLRPKAYDHKADTSGGIGLIAQQVLPVLPEVVVDMGDRFGINYSSLTTVLINAIQEIHTSFEDYRRQHP